MSLLNNIAIMNVQEYAIIIKSICNKLGIEEADSTLIRNVTTYCKGLNHGQLRELYPDKDDRHAMIIKNYLDSVSAITKEYDYEQHARSQTLKIKAAEDAKEMISPFTDWVGERMPMVSSKAMSVYIDSRVRNASDVNATAITDFGFTLVPRMTRAQLGDGRIQVRVMPSQITYFKLGKMVVPYPVSFRNHNFTKELTLTFTALRSNGIIAREDTFHFAFTYEVHATNPALVELTPVNKYCKFNPPLRVLDDLTLRFNDPIYPVSFNADRARVSSINYLSSDGRIAFDKPHGLQTGDVVVIMGLTTGDNSANASILTTINDPRGIVITRIDDNIIATGMDFTTIKSPVATDKPLVLFHSRTFRFPLEIGYQDITDLD